MDSSEYPCVRVSITFQEFSMTKVAISTIRFNMFASVVHTWFSNFEHNYSTIELFEELMFDSIVTVVSFLSFLHHFAFAKLATRSITAISKHEVMTLLAKIVLCYDKILKTKAKLGNI